ncbi:hypothetical protein OIO90_001817 [Microbotryomycetes sp. JL221]|nr:hypothetical protein OIO90_001817 [Microbotryomycetes sp. JL221]
MAPFVKARETQQLPSLPDGTAVFQANIDVDWSVFSKPHGGALLAVILDATSRLQQNSQPHHPDPAHIMSHFLTGTLPGEAFVHIKVVRQGKSWTNLYAELKQKDEVRITAQLLYTRMPDTPTTNPHPPFGDANLNLFPSSDSVFAKSCPFLTHPANCTVGQGLTDERGRRWSKDSVFNFVPSYVEWAEDLKVRKRRLESSSRKERELEWAAWIQFKGEDKVDQGSIGFFTDMMSSLPELFPDGQRVSPHYYPTLAMSVQFHARLPVTAPYLSSEKTIGCYGRGGPLVSEGRHEQLVEVWTAPGPIGKGEVQDQWKRRCLPLATSTQLALTVPAGKIWKNLGQGDAAKTKL